MSASKSTSEMIAEAFRKMGLRLMVFAPLGVIISNKAHPWIAVGGAVVGLGCFISGVVLEKFRAVR